MCRIFLVALTVVGVNILQQFSIYLWLRYSVLSGAREFRVDCRTYMSLRNRCGFAFHASTNSQTSVYNCSYVGVRPVRVELLMLL